ncbi:MAG: cupredoxin domain-containing protein [Actinobacteria bacterium]|nr:cupredoxin domain-containing protein [Actinomycetota bacterium]
MSRTLAATALTATVLGVGCGHSKHTPATGGASEVVRIASFRFMPANLTVRRGATITWANDDSADHTATADGGAFDTGNVRRGRRVSIRLNRAGTFQYHCDFHPFMRAVVVVK